MTRPICACGCGRVAEYLCTGFDYDPKAPNKRGRPFTDVPCCESSAVYLSECSAECDHQFAMRRVGP